MEKSKVIETPVATSCNLDKDEKGKLVEESKYQCMIGSVVYLTAARLDIMFVVCLCTCFQAFPKESHLNFFKFILVYPIDTQQMVLRYPRERIVT